MTDAEPQQEPRHRPKRRWKQWIALRLLSVAVIYAVYCGFLYIYQVNLIFPAYIANARGHTPFVVDDLHIHKLIVPLAEGGTVPAYFFPAEPGVEGPAVIMFHGNAELLEDQYLFVDRYHEMGVSVLLTEYRGYGEAAGSPSQVGITADMVALHDQLIGRPDVDAERIVYHGRSIGGGVAAQVAAQREPAAMILQSTFTSIASMTGRYLAPSFLCRHPFHTDRVLEQLDVPLLIFHGTEDTLVPVEHGRSLREIAPEARYVEYESDHDFFPGEENIEAYWREIETFLREAGIISVNPADPSASAAQFPADRRTATAAPDRAPSPDHD